MDNQRASLTVPVIHRLTNAGVHLLVCNEKHLPVSVDQNGKKMRVRNAIDEYVCSFTTAVTRGKPDCLQIPVIIRGDCYGEVD